MSTILSTTAIEGEASCVFVNRRFGPSDQRSSDGTPRMLVTPSFFYRREGFDSTLLFQLAKVQAIENVINAQSVTDL